MATILAAEKINEIRGIDGYAIYDERGILLESSIPGCHEALRGEPQNNSKQKGFITKQTGDHIKQLLAYSSDQLDSAKDLNSSVLLTERGAWSISKLKAGYLLLLAGYHEPVDIPRLTKIAAKIKSEIDMEDVL